MERMIVTKILTWVFAMYLSSMIVQSFITLKWQEKKVINNKNFKVFFLTTSILTRLCPVQNVHLHVYLLCLKEPTITYCKSVSKLLSPWLWSFITSQIFEVEAYFKLLWKVYGKGNMNINRKSENSEGFCLSQGTWKKTQTFLPRDLSLKILNMKPLNLLFWKKN